MSRNRDYRSAMCALPGRSLAIDTLVLNIREIRKRKVLSPNRKMCDVATTNARSYVSNYV